MALDMAIFLPHRPVPATLDMEDRITLWCLRTWLCCAQSGKSPRRALFHGLMPLGLESWSRTVGLFMEAAVSAWPEPLRMHPVGCGCPISYDESLLLFCVDTAALGARAPFDAVLADMTAAAERDRLWSAARRLRTGERINLRERSQP